MTDHHDASNTSNTNPSSSSYPPILRGLHAALGPDLLNSILNSRILLIGSGGIGCELLKNLALAGFRQVEVVDLDTIDVSNLNRQFLFRSHHVGLSKCLVASEAAMKLIPPLLVDERSINGNVIDSTNKAPANYIPHHKNVFDNTKFNVQYISTFDIVLNGLDNVAARRRMNRLCLAASIPMIEAGTTGYLGQVQVIDKGTTECYECQPKSTQKVYPICTIRSTPSQPVHCIVWAKELYKLCFGPKVDDSMLFEDEHIGVSVDSTTEEGGKEAGEGKSVKDDDDKEDEEKKVEDGIMAEGGKNDEEGKTSGGEPSTYMNMVKHLRCLIGVDSDDVGEGGEVAVRVKAREVLTALYVTEIEKQINLGKYKTAEKVPVPVSHADIDGTTDDNAPTAQEGYAPTDVWSPSDCIAELLTCFIEVSTNYTTYGHENYTPLPEFDKDDKLGMRFITAASNLRAYVFGIEPIQSLYATKGIAGNIIPAIATTNAIVAGLQVLQAFHILKANLDIKTGLVPGERNVTNYCKYIWCERHYNRKGYLLQPMKLQDPNPNCFVCRNAMLSITLNTYEWTLTMFLTRIIKRELGFDSPTIIIGEDIIYEEGEDIDPNEFVTILAKKMINLPGGGAGHGSELRIEDFTQDLEVEVGITHKEHWTIVDDETKVTKDDDREEIDKFIVGGKKPDKGMNGENGNTVGVVDAATAAARVNEAKNDDDNDDDDACVLESWTKGDDDEKGSMEQSKKHHLADLNESTTKKSKLDHDHV
jgi:ubiquitin-like 1-activating enzyme E1 B